jgi:hypothetical protein
VEKNMKKSQVYSIVLLTWLLLLMCATFTHAATPGYVDIENNNVYEWETIYDEGPLKDYWEDQLEDDGWSDSAIDAYTDQFKVDDELVGIKIAVLDVDDEETTPWGEDGVRIIYNYYIKEEGEEWDIKEKDETFAIWDYDDDVYDIFLFIFDWQDEWDEDDLEWRLYLYLKGENPWFISTKVDWDEVEEEIEEYLEDDLRYDDVDVDTDEDENRIEVELDYDDDDDVDERSYIVDYDNNGVLEYYEYSYDGEPIVIVQSQVAKAKKFINENMLWIIIGAIALVAIIIIIIVLIKRR